MGITQLIYVSDLVNADETHLAPIVESAVRHNQEDNISGMLLYSEGNFLQVLEGTPEQVEQTYQRVCRDPRHTNIFILTQEDVDERHFADWSMGFRKLSEKDIASFPEYAPYFQFGFNQTDFKAKPGVALEMLKLFNKALP